MPQRPAKPAAMPRITAYLTVSDPQVSLDFYAEAFGFESKQDGCISGPDGKIMHAEMRFADGVIMFGPEANCGGADFKTPAHSGVASPISLYVYCDDVDKLAKRAEDAGAQVVQKPETMFWGDRMCSVLDPDGHRWSFATNVADFDPSKAQAAMAGSA